MTDYEKTKEDIQNLVDKAFSQGIDVGYSHGLEVGTQNGYSRGYNNGQKSVAEKAEDEETVEDIYRKGFENGLEQAWECAKKLILNKKDGGLSTDEIKDIFAADAEDYTVFKNLSASEAIAKIKEYEQKQTDEMSLSDAIKWIKDYFRTTDMPMPQYEKAFEMAIKSMEYIDDHAL